MRRASAALVDADRLARGELPGQQVLGQRVLDEALDGTAQRAGSVLRVVALPRDESARGIGHFETDPRFGEPSLHAGEEQADDLFQLGLAERLEDDDLIDPVQELRAKVVAQAGLHPLGGRGEGIRPGLAGLDQCSRADVAGHDHDRVAEADGSALGIGQAPVVEELKQDVEDVGMGLLDLVEQHHLVRAAADRLGQLAALLVADVAGRSADQPRHGELLHVLAHVDPDHGALVVEQELGQRAGQLGLADPGGAQEDERADRSLRVLEPGAGTPDGVRDGDHRLVLADQPLVQPVLHVQQLLGLALHQAADRDARPARDDLGDVVGVDLLLEQERAG